MAVCVTVQGGGVRGVLKGALRRSAKRNRHGWQKVKGHLQEAGRSLAVFACGLLLASLYGAMALFLHHQAIWHCVYSVVGVAFLAAFGMGLSASIRGAVLLMVPSMCSEHGRNLLQVLCIALLLSGPLTNMMENTERVAATLMCGAELAANQTQELLQRAATPLLPVLDKIKEISNNAYAVAGRVQNFMTAMTDGTRHVARTLRNVLHFLVDIGDVCNDRMGSPYRKCRSVFIEARTDCNNRLKDFKALCQIVNVFMPLCKIAHATQFFCIIPSYIGSLIKARLAKPIVSAFEHMKQEFEFNISATVQFDVDVNSSRSLQEMAQGIMEDVSSQVHVFQKLSEPLAYVSLILFFWSFLRAVWYRRRYLRDDKFDNHYITAEFVELDQRLARGGGVSVLPVTRREANIYITPMSLRLTPQEWRATCKGVASVLTHMGMAAVLVVLDFLVFWMLDQIQHQAKGDVVARAPVMVSVEVNGSGYAADIFKDVVSAFNILQRGNITVISRKCLREPSEPDYSTSFILGFLYGLSLLLSLTRGYVLRCRRLICAFLHPDRELERIHFLRRQLLDQRKREGKALRASAARPRADGGGGGAGSCLRSLLRRLPGGVHLLNLLGVSTVSCLSCGEVVDKDMVACAVPECPALYCRPCFQSLDDTCALCMRSGTVQENSEEELDSSDDEQLMD